MADAGGKMKDRFLCFIFGLTALVSVSQGQVARRRRQRRTAKPSPADLDGASNPRRTSGSAGSLGQQQRHAARAAQRTGGRATLTDQEVAAIKKKAHELFGGKGDAAFGDTVFKPCWRMCKEPSRVSKAPTARPATTAPSGRSRGSGIIEPRSSPTRPTDDCPP